MRNRWISLVMWSAAAVVAVGAGTAAVSAASTGTGRDVMSQQDVARALAAQPVGAALPGLGAVTPAATATPGAAQIVRTDGGTLLVRCGTGDVTLLRWTPKTGFRADGTVSGPAAAVSVKFENNTSELTVTVTCVAGVAKASVAVDADHGRGGDNNAPGNGGPGNSGPGNSTAATPTPSGDDNGHHGGDDGPNHH